MNAQGASRVSPRRHKPAHHIQARELVAFLHHRWDQKNPIIFAWRARVRPDRVEPMFDGSPDSPLLSDHDGFRVTYELSWSSGAEPSPQSCSPGTRLHLERWRTRKLLRTETANERCSGASWSAGVGERTSHPLNSDRKRLGQPERAMKQMASNRIMVATDLSARSDRQVERAILLAQQLHCSLLVLHVVEGEDRLDREREQCLTELFYESFDVAPGELELMFEARSVPSTIAQVAEAKGCSLIVTGVAHFNSIGDFVLGTAVERLVRRSSVPVLVVKRRAKEAYGRLLVVTDFTECSKRALLIAADLFPQATLRLIHAYHPPCEAFLSRESTVDFVREENEISMARLINGLPEAIQTRIEALVEEGEHVGDVVGRNTRDWKP